MATNYVTVKVTPEFLAFVKKMSINRLRVKLNEDEPITLTSCLSLMEKYFKDNNNRYVEMISQEIHK